MKYLLKLDGLTYNPYKDFIVAKIDNKIEWSTKNVIYLSEDGDNIKVYVKSLDEDHYTTTLCLREEDYTSKSWKREYLTHHTNRQNDNTGEDKGYSCRSFKKTVYELNLDLKLNIYYIPKSKLKYTGGIKHKISRRNRGKRSRYLPSPFMIDHSIKPMLRAGDGVFYKVHGRKLEYSETI